MRSSAWRVTGLIVLALSLVPVVALAGKAQVTVHDGLVSATFDATPSPDALDAIHRATGLELVVPLAALQRTLSLTVAQAPLERFLTRLLDALDLAGYALVYAPGGETNRVIAVARGGEGPAPALSKNATSPASGPTLASPMRPLSVPFLIRKAEAESMKLGLTGQMIVADSPPVAKIKTSECEGGDAAVQTAVITDAQNTYLTSLIVCSASGLTPGQTLSVAPNRTGGLATSDGNYSRFTATSR